MTPQSNTTNTPTPTPAQTRADGYYWVKKGEQCEIAKWVAGRWIVPGWMPDSYWDEIDERPINRAQKTKSENDCIRLMYDELLIENKNNRWINPVLTDLDTPFSENHFSVEIDDFIDIASTSNVMIYRVIKQMKKYTIFCKPLNDND